MPLMGSSTATPGRSSSGFRSLPNPYAVLGQRLVFTTLTPKEVAQGPYIGPQGLGQGAHKPMHMFSLDDEMVYTPFKNDHGPLNLAYTFDACVRIYDKLNSGRHPRRAICLYSSPCPRAKSNMALMAALYSLIVEHQDPWDAYQAISHFELLPFRDAGNGVNEYLLSAQDVLYGIWKAGRQGLLNLQKFDPAEYRFYERVENGDLNILGDFIAFASPMDVDWMCRNTPPGEKEPQYTQHQKDMLAGAFEKVTNKFREEDVGLVVRLNDELYDRTHFLQNGIEHVDMYFDDGTNPTDEIVRDFIRIAGETIARGKKVAVHCKAGLGRTGVLIGAYLIYKYQFTASEVIGYMRVIRPGMVVGPQQRYMQLNQMKWAGWAVLDEHRASMSAAALPPSPPLESDATLSPVLAPPEPAEEPAPTAAHKAGDAKGQPRKLRITPADLTPEPEERPVEPPSTPKREPGVTRGASPTGSEHDGSVRGVKRGSGRSPLPQTMRGDSPPPRAPEPTYPRLARSPSNASCSSQMSELDQRATKRRNGDSPPLAKSGLSSPPPSRDATPEEEIPPVTFPIEEGEEPVTPPTNTRALEPLLGCPSTPIEATPRSRSLLPRRAALSTLKDKEKDKDSLSPLLPSSSTEGSVSDSEGTASSASSINSTRSKLPLRRTLVASPRVWNTLSRISGAALGHDCELDC